MILYRSEGVKDRTRLQTIRRLRTLAKLKDPGRVTWYSVRHTLSDWLDTRVSGRARSMLLGHLDFDRRERRRLLDEGSPIADIYRREKLGPLYKVAELLDQEWWPEIQKHCKVDLRLQIRDTIKIQPETFPDIDQRDRLS